MHTTGFIILFSENPQYVISGGKEHKTYKKGKADAVAESLIFCGNGFSYYCFNKDEENSSSVKCGDGEEIEKTYIYCYKCQQI